MQGIFALARPGLESADDHPATAPASRPSAVHRLMSPPRFQTFRIHWRSAPVGLVILWFGLGMWWVWPRELVLIALAVELVLALVLLFSLFTVSVADEGLVLYRVNQLRWSQVSGVRAVRWFGMPHLVISRRNGGRWWMPLYLYGLPRLERALAEKAPIGNPLRLYAESALAARLGK